jgi:hypothetical protein
MPETRVLSPLEATDKLVAQFGRPSETLDVLTETMGDRVDAIAALTATVAPGFSHDQPEHEYLNDWHSFVRADCSSTYDRLRTANPGASREEINQDDNLQILNGIRRGVHMAIVRYQNARRDRVWRTRARV